MSKRGKLLPAHCRKSALPANYLTYYKFPHRELGYIIVVDNLPHDLCSFFDKVVRVLLNLSAESVITPFDLNKLGREDWETGRITEGKIVKPTALMQLPLAYPTAKVMDSSGRFAFLALQFIIVAGLLNYVLCLEKCNCTYLFPLDGKHLICYNFFPTV